MTNSTESRFSGLEIEGQPTNQPSGSALSLTEMNTPTVFAEADKQNKTTRAYGQTRTVGGVNINGNPWGQIRSEDGVRGNESAEGFAHIDKTIVDKKYTPFNSLVELADGLAEKKSDELVLRRDLAVTVEDYDLKLMGRDMTKTSYKQLLGVANIHPEAAKYVSLKYELQGLADNINEDLKHYYGGGDEQCLLRNYDIDGEKITRAVLGHRYSVFDTNQLLHVISETHEGFDKALVTEISIDEDGGIAKVMLPDFMKAMPDSDYGIGLTISDNEVGGGSARVQPYLYRAVCGNGIVLGLVNSTFALRQTHAGIDMDAIRNELRNVVGQALGYSEQMLEYMTELQGVAIDNLRAVHILANKYGLTKEQAKAWARGLRFEPGDTVFTLVNGLTRGAQEFSGSDRMEVESMASQIMIGNRPDIDLRDLMANWSTVSIKVADTNIEDKDLAYLVNA